MHVLYLFPHFIHPGGAALVTLSTAKIFAERGAKVTILAQEGSEEILSGYDNIDFRFVGGPLPKSLSYWLGYPLIYSRVNKEIRDIDPDIIFPQVFPANYWGFFYKLLNPDSRLVWYCHEPSAFVHNTTVIDGLPQRLKTLANLARPILVPFDKYMGGRCDGVIVNSEFTARNVRKIYGANSTKAYPGVDTAEFPLQPPEKESFFLFAGVLTKFKRVDLLIRAVADIASTGRHVELKIVGDGPDKGRLMSLVRELSVQGNVQFLGELSRPGLIDVMSRAMCVLFPSIEEPLGMVPLEAQAAFTPVIAFRSGGCLETVVDKETGILVEPYTHQRMSEAMVWALENKEQMEEMGRHGRCMVEEKFSWANAVDIIMREFNYVTDRRSVRPKAIP